MMGITSPIGKRLDALAPGKFHVRMLWLIGADMLFDGFDIYLAAGVLGALVREGVSNVDTNAWCISATFAGMTVGAWLAGVLGDRYGDRFSYQFDLAVFGLVSIAAAAAAPVVPLSTVFQPLMLGAPVGAFLGYSMSDQLGRKRGKVIFAERRRRMHWFNHGPRPRQHARHSRQMAPDQVHERHAGRRPQVSEQNGDLAGRIVLGYSGNRIAHNEKSQSFRAPASSLPQHEWIARGAGQLDPHGLGFEILLHRRAPVLAD